MNKEILEFIHRRFPIDCNWLNGNCYYFALILAHRFNGTIYYIPDRGHFVCKIDDKFYDYTGEITPSTFLEFDYLHYSDITHYKRLVRDCIK